MLSQQDVHRVYRVCAVCRDNENEGNRLTRSSMAEALIGTTPPVSFAVSSDPSSTWNARAFALASSAIAALLGRHLFRDCLQPNFATAGGAGEDSTPPTCFAKSKTDVLHVRTRAQGVPSQNPVHLATLTVTWRPPHCPSGSHMPHHFTLQ